MKLKYQLSRLAVGDLENIWNYTFANWSLKQADKYIKQIVKQIEEVSLSPEIGRPIFRISPNHRMIKVNSHLIVYKIEKEILKIDRIIHEKMDIKHLI